MSYENITLEKGMYNVKGGITAALESLDPSENYKGTDLEGLDAYQRQLKRFGIKVAGTLLRQGGKILFHIFGHSTFPRVSLPFG